MGGGVLNMSGYKAQAPNHYYIIVFPIYLGFQERVLPGNLWWKWEEAVVELGEGGQGEEEKEK